MEIALGIRRHELFVCSHCFISNLGGKLMAVGSTGQSSGVTGSRSVWALGPGQMSSGKLMPQEIFFFQ